MGLVQQTYGRQALDLPGGRVERRLITHKNGNGTPLELARQPRDFAHCEPAMTREPHLNEQEGETGTVLSDVGGRSHFQAADTAGSASTSANSESGWRPSDELLPLAADYATPTNEELGASTQPARKGAENHHAPPLQLGNGRRAIIPCTVAGHGVYRPRTRRNGRCQSRRVLLARSRGTIHEEGRENDDG